MVKPHSGRSSCCSSRALYWYPTVTNYGRVQIPSKEAVAFNLLVRDTTTCFMHGIFASQPIFAQSGDEVNDAVSQKTWGLQSEVALL